jgi:hypothetical protein
VEVLPSANCRKPPALESAVGGPTSTVHRRASFSRLVSILRETFAQHKGPRVRPRKLLPQMPGRVVQPPVQSKVHIESAVRLGTPREWPRRTGGRCHCCSSRFCGRLTYQANQRAACRSVRLSARLGVGPLHIQGNDWVYFMHSVTAAALRVTVSHSITRSARKRVADETATPSAAAVFMLIANSKTVGRSIGMSAGLAPLRILSTKTGARR